MGSFVCWKSPPQMNPSALNAWMKAQILAVVLVEYAAMAKAREGS